MNRLRHTLEEITREAPPVGDLAERAVARARRRSRLGIGGSAVGLAVAGVTAAALVATGLPEVPLLREDGNITAASGERTGEAAERIELPEATPDPLPASGVGPAELAYALNCRGVSDRVECATPRILTADGRHWRVADALPPTLEEHNGQVSLQRPGGFAVSPDGSRLAYVRKDGKFVIRELVTGDVTPLFSVSGKEEDLAWGDMRLRWSPDGRRVTLHYSSLDLDAYPPDGEVNPDGQDFGPAGMLVDTETMEAVPLPAPCCVLALPPGDRPVLMQDSYDNASELLAIGPDGTIQERLPFDEVARLLIYSGTEWTRISPDGESMVGISMVDEGRERSKGDTRSMSSDPRVELLVIDPTTGRLRLRHRLPASFNANTDILGWADGSSVLAGEFPGDGFDAMLDEVPGWHGSDVYAVNVETGQIGKALEFGEAKPALLSLATGLP